MLSSGIFSDGYFRIASGRSSRELTKTRAVTIDHLVGEFGPPTHIKIDVEGYEGAVIRGAKKALAGLAPVLFLELHNEMIRSEGGDPVRVLDDLAEMRYESLSIDGVLAERGTILKMPICRLVAKRLSTPLNKSNARGETRSQAADAR
jgi:Methyltransferase FkbM domain